MDRENNKEIIHSFILLFTDRYTYGHVTHPYCPGAVYIRRVIGGVVG